MILEFRMKNVLSYKNDVVYSMIAPNNKVKMRYQDNYTSLNGFDILKTAVIVGENAGGKSNFIKGLQYFKTLFKQTSEQPKIEPDKIFNEDLLIDDVPDEPMDNEQLLQKFSIIVTATNGLIYKYDVSISWFGIEHESLFYTDDKNHTFKKVFECITSYDEMDIKKIRKIYLDIPGNKKIQELVTDNLNSGYSKGLIINSLSLLGIPNASNFINEVNDIKIYDLQTFEYYGKDALKPYLSLMKTKEFSEIFRMVDSSIVGVEIDDDFPLLNSLVKRRRLDGSISKREIAFDSTGVKKFLFMAVLIYKVVYENAIIFNDEMDSTFNPVLTSRVISFIHSFETKGQFVFTTHNIFNLTFQMFMKEQMFIVEKNKDTLESKIYSLAEFNEKELRYDSNEKIYEYYLKGVLGGVGSAI